MNFNLIETRVKGFSVFEIESMTSKGPHVPYYHVMPFTTWKEGDGYVLMTDEDNTFKILHSSHNFSEEEKEEFGKLIYINFV